MERRWRGVLAIPQTPFRDDLSVDYEELAREVQYCVDQGVHGLVYPAIASEWQYLTPEERMAGIRVVLRASAGRVPVIAGATGKTTHETIDIARMAADAGADGIVSMPPAGLIGDDDVLRFFERLADACSVPIILQSASPPHAVAMPVSLVARVVCETEGVRYVKEEVLPSTHRLSAILAAAGPSLWGVFGGRAGLHMLDELNRGGAGIFPGASWADFHVGIVESYFAGWEDEARARFNRLLPAINMGVMLGLGFTKHVLVRRGVLTSARCRDGSPPLDQHDIRELDQIWADLRPSVWDG